ncbi:uncharacterized protein [Linepithema humile]|uniref:uncharacterized protein n=1 Tax=Linepithema humile TaxID=83485 RepID=UPI000623A099|nr:PREDICTED: uncharacterized protein LOC105678551 [Linepithema humile]
MLFHLLLIATSPFLITAFPQNSGTGTMSQVDGFVFDGPTASRPNIGQRTTLTTIATSTTSLPLDDTQFNSCVSSCPATPEYNPVCGTDNVDYTNPGGLGCAQRCGKEVLLRHYGRCSTSMSG